jgi:hypothetical protein
MVMTYEQMTAVVNEVERLWRSRTPPKSIYDVMPGYRVNRSELNMIIRRMFGEHESVPLRDDDFDRMMIALFDRLRAEFPGEQWDREENAATKERRKELGLPAYRRGKGKQ